MGQYINVLHDTATLDYPEALDSRPEQTAWQGHQGADQAAQKLREEGDGESQHDKVEGWHNAQGCVARCNILIETA